MTFQYSSLRRGRSGLTLIELLIVCFIIVLFVALAAPLLQPNTPVTKIREAARQLNGYFAEAKSFAAQRGRSVALVLDRSAAASEGSNDPNLVTRLYISEAPPHYAGDTLSSLVAANFIPRDPPAPINVTQLEWPPWYLCTPPAAGPTVPPSGTVIELFPPQIGANKAVWYALNFTPPLSATMLDVIMTNYLQPASRFAPFRIRFGGRGSYFDGYVQYTGPLPPTAAPVSNFSYFCWAPYGKSPPPGNVAYQIEFPPVPSLDSPLEMPTGTCVDLQYSGFQFCDPISLTQFAAAEPASASFATGNPLPLSIVFGPGGDVERITANGTIIFQPNRMHFLVGTTARAIESAGDITLRTTNLNDRSCQWVSVNSRTGFIATSDNGGFDTLPPDASQMGAIVAPLDYRGTAIGRARALAGSLNTKGGR